MSNCEQRRKKISSPIYDLDIITDGSREINDDACKVLFKTRKPGSENNYTHDKDFDTCEKNIEWARDKYQSITKDCPPSGGMRKRRKSRRTKRKRNTLKKNKRTKRRSLKKSRRTRRH